MKNCIIRMAAFAALCATAAAPALADRTVSADCTLAGDEDWRADGVITLSGGATIDLAGHDLQVHSINGSGAVVSSASGFADLTSAGGDIGGDGPIASLPAENAFDDDLTTFASRTSNSSAPFIISYGFDAATLVNRYRIYAYTSVASPGFPVDWTFEGSDDGSTWTVLDTRSGEAMAKNNWYTYDFANDTAYFSYRIRVTRGSRWNGSIDPRIDVGELEFGTAAISKVFVDASGMSGCDFSQISVSPDAAIVPTGDFTLTADLDMGDVPLSCDIDLNGHTLTVKSLPGGAVTDTSHLAAFTDLTSSGGTIGSSGGIHANYPASNLFDNDTGTFALRGTTSAEPIVVSYGFGAATLVNRYRIYAYTSVSAPGFPADWTFEGSDDGSVWTVLDTRSGEAMSKGNWYAYDFANAVAYRYYRIRITKGSRWNGSADPRLDVGGELDLGCRPAAGRLVLNVPAGRTFSNTDMTLSGNLRLVKAGAGTLVASKSGQEYLGGTEVAAGTLRCGAAVAGLFGIDGSEILVSSGGTFDIAGKRANDVNTLGKYAFVLDGGTLANSAAVTGGANYQNPMRLALTSDSAFDITAHGFLGTETADLVGEFDLGGHTFSGAIGDGQYFRVNNMAMNNGAFKVENATTGRLFIGYGEGVVATNVDFTLNCPVVVRGTCTFKVRGYESLGGASNGSTQYGAMEVYGAFRPTSDCFYGCTLMDGSTLDLSTRSTPLNALSAMTGGCTNLAFAANATVGVTLGSRRIPSDAPLMSWTAATKPANLDTVRFVNADADRQYSLVVKEDGLYAQTGFMVMFR